MATRLFARNRSLARGERPRTGRYFFRNRDETVQAPLIFGKGRDQRPDAAEQNFCRPPATKSGTAAGVFASLALQQAGRPPQAPTSPQGRSATAPVDHHRPGLRFSDGGGQTTEDRRRDLALSSAVCRFRRMEEENRLPLSCLLCCLSSVFRPLPEHGRPVGLVLRQHPRFRERGFFPFGPGR